MTSTARIEMLADRVAGLLPMMQDRADELDRRSAFPAAEIAALAKAGALTIPLPVRSSETSPHLADQLAAVLTLAGQGNLSVGRILEAHINALHLVGRYGSATQWHKAMRDAEEGRLFALWVTDPPIGGLRMQRASETIRLSGGKQFCSAAGHASRAVVTAQDQDGLVQMLVVSLGNGESATALPSPLQGMRAAVTGAVDFSACDTPVDSVLGEPGDYLREPDFSAGAWRGSAVALGGLIALVEKATQQLLTSGRLDSPHTQARLGRVVIARETARLWVRHAGRVAEDPSLRADERTAVVGLARLAVEAACLDAMQLLQRSLGLSAFRQGTAVERVCRDLQTYLRQPAPDEVLTEAALWFTGKIKQ